MNSILSIRTYINTCIILLPTILLSLHSSTHLRTFQSLYIVISSYAPLAWTGLAGITLAGLIVCLAIFFPVAPIISITNIFTLCLRFNWKVFERQQLYKIWQYMGLLIICPHVYDPIYSSSNSACSKVHWNIDDSMYTSFGLGILSMKSTCSSQRPISIYEAWSCLEVRTKSLPFDTQQITTMNVVFGNSWRSLLAFLPMRSTKSVTSG